MSTLAYTPAENRYENAPFRRCGRSGLVLPPISLGFWNNFGEDAEAQTQRALVRRAFDLGVTHLDLANNYGPPPGSAEEHLGAILRADFTGHRDELVISTKAGYTMWPGPYGDHGSRKYLLSSLDQSLGRLGVDYVDIFYHHRMDEDTPLEETRGQGVGHLLLEELLGRARDLRLARVFCLTFEVGFFERHGFTELTGDGVAPETYVELLRSLDPGVAEFLDLARVKPNTLGNTRMIRSL